LFFAIVITALMIRWLNFITEYIIYISKNKQS
jgi:hypothetical protein